MARGHFYRDTPPTQSLHENHSSQLGSFYLNLNLTGICEWFVHGRMQRNTGSTHGTGWMTKEATSGKRRHSVVIQLRVHMWVKSIHVPHFLLLRLFTGSAGPRRPILTDKHLSDYSALIHMTHTHTHTRKLCRKLDEPLLYKLYNKYG